MNNITTIKYGKCYVGRKDHEDCTIELVGSYIKTWNLQKGDNQKTKVTILFCQIHETQFSSKSKLE